MAFARLIGSAQTMALTLLVSILMTLYVARARKRNMPVVAHTTLSNLPAPSLKFPL